MRLLRRALIPLCTLAVGIALMMPDSSLGQAEKKKSNQLAKSRSVEQSKNQEGSTEKGNVIGYLQTRDKVVTIVSGANGTAYTIKTKDGKTLAMNLNEKDLKIKYPALFQQIKSGLAGNDATLRTKSVPMK